VGVLRQPGISSPAAEGVAVAEPVVVERVATPRGELVLRRCGDDYEVISNGTFLMDTRAGESERLLVDAAMARHAAPRNLLIGGLGVGFSLAAALAHDALERIVVVEVEPSVIAWNRTHLADCNGHALDDPRVLLANADLLDHLARADERFDAICLDIDNGPDWAVTEANTRLYDAHGTQLLASRLRPGGVMSVWSAARSATYLAVLSRHFRWVEVHAVEVARGEPDVVIVAGSA
jgi:spermidine synthase